MTVPAFPKPKDVKSKRKYLDDDGVYRYPDGREVCDLKQKKGMDEYLRRKRVNWEKQNRICPLCGLRLCWKDATVDHKVPRGMGAAHRDDRLDATQSVHSLCNSQKGSRRIDFLDVP